MRRSSCVSFVKEVSCSPSYRRYQHDAQTERCVSYQVGSQVSANVHCGLLACFQHATGELVQESDSLRNREIPDDIEQRRHFAQTCVQQSSAHRKQEEASAHIPLECHGCHLTTLHIIPVILIPHHFLRGSVSRRSRKTFKAHVPSYSRHQTSNQPSRHTTSGESLA